jgi:hypothetical protein
MKLAASAFARPIAHVKTVALRFALLLFGVPLVAQSHPFISFDPPDAEFGTFPMRITANGQIVGYYGGPHGDGGFVRSADGTITEFSVPSLVFTHAVDMNSHGQIVGFGGTQENRDNNRGFLRTPSGSYLEISYPGAYNTLAVAINDNGVVVGEYQSVGFDHHGFVRDPSGNYTPIDVPGAQSTQPLTVNNAGEIAGAYLDSNSLDHGFVRSATGKLTVFDAPGSVQTVPGRLNNNGEVAGYYIPASGPWAAFIRHSDGSFTIFALQGADHTYANSLNNNGYACGFEDSSAGQNGFLRHPSGKLFQFSGPQPNPGGACSDVNDTLRATGSYIDSGVTRHGWFR